jgi:hypothetical protein
MALKGCLALDALELARATGDLVHAVQRAGGRDLAEITGKDLVAVAIAPGAGSLEWACSARQIERVGADDGSHMERPAAGIIVGDTPKIARPEYVVFPDLKVFSHTLPTAMDFESAGSRQGIFLLRQCRGRHSQSERRHKSEEERTSRPGDESLQDLLPPGIRAARVNPVPANRALRPVCIDLGSKLRRAPAPVNPLRGFSGKQASRRSPRPPAWCKNRPQKAEARRRRAEGATLAELARSYDVSRVRIRG